MQLPLQKHTIGNGPAQEDGDECNDHGGRGPAEEPMRQACVLDGPHPEAKVNAKQDSTEYDQAALCQRSPPLICSCDDQLFLFLKYTFVLHSYFQLSQAQ